MSGDAGTATPAPRVEEREGFLVAGLCQRYDFASIGKIPDQWRRFETFPETVPGRAGSAAYGVMLPVPGLADGFDYLTGVEVAGLDGLPDELSHAFVPAATYAIFEHRGPASRINETWQAVCGQWLPRAGLEIADEPVMFERYGADFDPQASEGAVGLWVPVKLPSRAGATDR